MSSLHENSPLGVYLDYLRQGKLAYQVAGRTGQPVFFPRVLVPGSGETDLEWRVSDGVGTVYATTVISPRGEPPYNVALIELDEGYRMMSRVEGCDPAAVRIGQRVMVEIRLPAEGDPLPVFRPLEGGVA